MKQWLFPIGMLVGFSLFLGGMFFNMEKSDERRARESYANYILSCTGTYHRSKDECDQLLKALDK